MRIVAHLPAAGSARHARDLDIDGGRLSATAVAASRLRPHGAGVLAIVPQAGNASGDIVGG